MVAAVIAVFLVACMAILLLLVFGICIRILWWVVENAELARLYRAGQTGGGGPPQVGGFVLVYKEGRAKKSTWVPGNTEAEAMAEALKLNIRYDHIVSLTKK